MLKKYKSNIDNLFKDLALKHIPGKAGDFSRFGETSAASNPSNEAPKPNLNTAVFVKAVDDVQGVYIEDEAGREREEEYDMEKNSQLVLRYKSVSHLIQSGAVKLV